MPFTDVLTEDLVDAFAALRQPDVTVERIRPALHWPDEEPKHAELLKAFVDHD